MSTGLPEGGGKFRFELFVALRYLRAKRKQAVISVITIISVMGVAAGVMALVIALAVNNGFRATLTRTLLGAMAHINILEREPGAGIENWRPLVGEVKKLPHVISASPTIYGQVFLAGPLRAEQAILKGIDLGSPAEKSDLQRILVEGSLDDIDKSGQGGIPGIVLGRRLAQRTGMVLNSRINVISPQGEPTPFGMRPAYYAFRVVGIFETGFYDIDLTWAYSSMGNVQNILAVGDVANAIEVKVDQVELAPAVAADIQKKVLGKELEAQSWQEQNRHLFGALKMERIVTVITIGLIELVAALNILISLVMMVMEKHRDIALLVTMGARREQIRSIFLWQGALIGITGTALGLALGYSLSFLANHYRLIQLDETVYSIAFVPFEPRWWDALWIAGGAILVSLLATIYPARSAAKILPAVALRYE